MAVPILGNAAEREPAVPEGSLTFGLKFWPGDAPHLRMLYRRVELGEMGVSGAGLYRDAAEATEKDEPLMVFCERPEEIMAMAYAFVTLGCRAPEIWDYNPRRA